MTPEQPDRQGPDSHETIRLRFPHPGQPAEEGAPEDPYTKRLPYTPDMLPDVPHYEAKPPKSGWWWVIVAGSAVVIIAIVAVVVILWIRNNADAPARAYQVGTALTPA